MKQEDKKTEIRKLLGTENIILGAERTIKALRQGSLTKVIISSNCSASIKATIKQLAEQNKTILSVATETNEELGVLCKKPFRVAVIGIQ